MENIIKELLEKYEINPAYSGYRFIRYILSNYIYEEFYSLDQAYREMSEIYYVDWNIIRRRVEITLKRSKLKDKTTKQGICQLLLEKEQANY